MLFCGRKTDRIKALLYEGVGWLLCYKLDHPNVFNEAEILTENGFQEEPTIEEAVPERKPRPKGKRAVDLAGIKTTTESHYLEESVFNSKFPQGWHQFEDEVYKELKHYYYTQNAPK